MIKGAKRNLEHYLSNGCHEFLLADAKALPFTAKVTSIATDPPYGRSTSTYGKEIELLLDQFLEEATQVLVPGGVVAIGMFEEIPLGEIVADAGLELVLLEKIYIHKSLTRRIGVCKKK